MSSIQEQIAHLQAQIAHRENELADLEAEVLDLQRELDEFQKRYDRLVRPLTERLELLQSLIAELETRHSPPPAQLRDFTPQPVDPDSTWSPPPGYVSVEEQFRRTWQKPDDSPDIPMGSSWTPPDDYVPVEEQFRRTWQRPAPQQPAVVIPQETDPKALKRIYRQLARRFHPDLTTDPIERERRNRLMAEINAAYTRRDSATLYALMTKSDTTSELPLEAIQLQQVQQILAQLDQRIVYLNRQRHTLLHSDMMDLKLQESLNPRPGSDILRDMANRLERDYAAAQRRLDELRGL